MELTGAIRAYVEGKIQNVEKFIIAHKQEEVFTEIEIGKTTNHHNSGEVFRAEAMIRVRGKQFRAVSEKDDLYAAIDSVRDELVREINSNKGRERALIRRGAWMVKNLLRFGRAKR